MLHSERLRSFLAFGETLNFTQAARHLHLSQPSLFVQIKKLEEELNVALYEKSGRQLHLTAAGETLLAHARESQRRDAALRAQLSERESNAPLVLAAGQGALLYLLENALIALGKSEGHRLRVLTRNSEETVKAVIQGEATVGVTALSGSHPRLDSQRLKLVGLCAVMPKSHALARRRALTIQHLSEVPIVTAPHGYPHRKTLDALFAAAGAEFNVAVEANGWAAMMHLASLGLGIALVNDFCSPPRGCVARPVRQVTKLEYRLLWRSGDSSLDTTLMRKAIANTPP